MCVPFGDREFPNENSVILRTADQPAIRVSAGITGLFDGQGYRLGLKWQKRDRKTATVLLGEGLCCDRRATVQETRARTRCSATTYRDSLLVAFGQLDHVRIPGKRHC